MSAAGEAALAAALKLHRAGRLDEAQRRYEEVLAAERDHAEAHHLLGLVLQQKGRHQAAAALLGRAVALEPAAALYRYHLAEALWMAGDLGAAIDAYAASIARDPDFADAHFHLGNALLERGRARDAVAALARAAELSPDDAEIRNNLGNAHTAAGDAAAAAAAYRAALGLVPGFRAARINLAQAAFDADDLDDAEALYRALLDGDGGDAAAAYGLGHVMARRGRLDQAVALFERAAAGDPAFLGAWLDAAALDERLVAGVDAARFEALLAAPGQAPATRTALHHGLGRLYDRRGEYDRAFAHIAAGNALHRERAPYERGRMSEAVDRLIETFDAEFFAARGDWGAAGERAVLVVGMPRSGTSLVEQILASHPAAHGAGEIGDLRAVIGGLARSLRPSGPMPGAIRRLDAAGAAAAGADYLARLAALGGEARRVVDKLPQNFLNLGYAAILLRDLRVVHCRRDAMDTCLSCFFTPFARGHHFSYDLGDLGAYYRDYERLMAHWRAVLPRPLLDLDYEALVARPEATTRALIDFVGLDWDPRCLAFHETERTVRTASYAQVRRPVYASSAGRWRRYEKHLAPLARALAGG